MPNRNRVSHQSFSRGPKRLTEWGICTVPTGYSSVAANAKAIAVLVPAATLEPESPATIVRTRLELSIRASDTSSDTNMVGAFGCGLVNVVAGALGITALPGPSTDCTWPGWFVWQPIVTAFQVTTDVGFQGQIDRKYTIDSKSMRKFKSDQSLVFMIENNTAVAWLFAVAGRMLVKAG